MRLHARITAFLVILLVGAQIGLAQAPESNVRGFMKRYTGRYWEEIPAGARIEFLIGYLEGAQVTAQMGGTKGAFEFLHRISPKATYGELVQGLDQFYGQPENLGLTIDQALEIFAMKVNGAASKEIEETLTICRQLAKTWQESYDAPKKK